MKGWRRWFTPSISDCVFAATLLWLVLFTVFGGDTGLLQDSNTGYHIRSGDFILQHGAVPTRDIFSFTKPGQKWFAWEWLCAAQFAWLHEHMGLKGVVLVSAALLALANLVMFRCMIWNGANILVALLLLHLAIGASSIHYLARPHAYTFLFLAISLWLIEADRRTPTRAVWLLVPLTALWVNLHGGFLSLLISLAIVAAGTALEMKGRQAIRYSLLLAACTLASGLNPYGFQVHAHAFQFLSQKWVAQLVSEYQSPQFTEPASRYFEVLLILGAMLAGRLLIARQYATALLVLAWGHAGLTSTRHIPIFAFVVSPFLAAESARLWSQWVGTAEPRSLRAILDRIVRDHTPKLRRTSIWGLVLFLFLWFSDAGLRWPSDFPSNRYPVLIATKHGELLTASRLFTLDSWADYLTFRNYPRQRVFVDGRCDFFGREMSFEYLKLLRGEYGWDQVLERYGIDAALIPTQSALASLLRQRPNWRVIDDDGYAMLLQLSK